MSAAAARDLGFMIRSLRERKNLGLRELARKAKISPAFLSKVERGEATPPSEKKLKALAAALDCDKDVLLALSGRLPGDVVKIIQTNPRECVALLRELRDVGAENLMRLTERLKSDKTYIMLSSSNEQSKSLFTALKSKIESEHK